MKPFLTLLLCCFALFAGQAQTFTWSNDADSFAVAATDTDLGFYTTVDNNSLEPIVIIWWVKHFNPPTSNWDHYHCSDVICWALNDMVDTMPIESNGTTSFDSHIMMNMDTGDGSITVCMYDLLDSANSNACRTYTAITDTTIGILDHRAESQWLKQNAPNPFYGNTTINYSLPAGSGLLRIHDAQGRFVSETHLYSNAGSISLGDELKRGMYFYSLWSEDRMIAVKRMQVAE